MLESALRRALSASSWLFSALRINASICSPSSSSVIESEGFFGQGAILHAEDALRFSVLGLQRAASAGSHQGCSWVWTPLFLLP